MFKYLRLLLLPFSAVYGIVVLIRNKLYDWDIFKSTEFNLPVICVGNLVVGGSGKSPVTEYLVGLLDGYKIAILSRGYGRKTTGFILADEQANANTIGDEPMQFYRKFPKVTVAVCEDRVYGIEQLKDKHDLIILDDAYQHRAVKPGYTILLFEFNKLLRPQFLLPAGNLREPFSGYHRAQSLLVTKAPVSVSSVQQNQCAEKFNTEGQIQLAFSSLEYGQLMPLISGEIRTCESIHPDTTIFLLTGIANPKPLADHLKQFSARVEHYDYPDHYKFTTKDVEKLVKAFKQHPSKEKIIITTEKDAQRLLNEILKELLLNLPVFYLPIQINIMADDKAIFDQKILNYVSIHRRDRTIY
jgi:tetraacyldisaccharide 4'-kinase